jgi:hypothetical protein
VAAAWSAAQTICGVLWLTLSGGVGRGVAEPAIQHIGAWLLAVALGNFARELASSCCAQVMSWAGRDFTRRGATFDGKTSLETLHPEKTRHPRNLGTKENSHGAVSRLRNSGPMICSVRIAALAGETTVDLYVLGLVAVLSLTTWLVYRLAVALETKK